MTGGSPSPPSSRLRTSHLAMRRAEYGSRNPAASRSVHRFCPVGFVSSTSVGAGQRDRLPLSRSCAAGCAGAACWPGPNRADLPDPVPGSRRSGSVELIDRCANPAQLKTGAISLTGWPPEPHRPCRVHGEFIVIAAVAG
jgi:hypothetical protein